MSTVPTPNRGEVWLIDFDPAIGAEISKVRPAAVLNVDSVGRLPLRLVVPLKDWKPRYAPYPWFVAIPAAPANRPAQVSGPVAVPTNAVSISRFVQPLVHRTPAQLDP